MYFQENVDILKSASSHGFRLSIYDFNKSVDFKIFDKNYWRQFSGNATQSFILNYDCLQSKYFLTMVNES